MSKKTTRKSGQDRQSWIDQLGDLADKNSSAQFLSSLKDALKKDGFTLENLLFEPIQSGPNKNWQVIHRLLINPQLQPLTDLIRQYPQTLRSTDSDGLGLLFFAVYYGRLEALNQLLTLCKELDAEAINVFKPGGMPPLAQALTSNDAVSSRLLLEAGADRDQEFTVNGQITTPRQLAQQHGATDLFEGKKVPFPDQKTHWAFMESLQNRQTFEIQAVLTTYRFTPAQLRWQDPDKGNDTLLHAAIKGGSLDAVRQLLTLMGTAGQQKLLILETNNQGQNAVSLATELGLTDIVSHLQAAGEFEPAEWAALINRANQRTGGPELNQPNRHETAKEIAPEKPALAAPATAPNVAPKPESLLQPSQKPAAQAPKSAAPAAPAAPKPAPRPALAFADKRPADQKRQFLAACNSRDASQMPEMLAHIELAPILHELALNGAWPEFDFLVEQIGVDAAAPRASKKDASTPLHTAAQRRQIDFILRVAEKYPQLLSHTTPERETPLHTFLLAASAQETTKLLAAAQTNPTLLTLLDTAPAWGISPVQALQNHQDRHGGKNAALQELKKTLQIGKSQDCDNPPTPSPVLTKALAKPPRPPNRPSATSSSKSVPALAPTKPYVAVEMPLPSTSGIAPAPKLPERKDSAGSASSSELPLSKSTSTLDVKAAETTRPRAASPLTQADKDELWRLYKLQSEKRIQQEQLARGNTAKTQAVIAQIKALNPAELAYVKGTMEWLRSIDESIRKKETATGLSCSK